MAMASLFLTSILWYVFYPVVYQLGESIELYGGTGSYFGVLIQNTWTWVGVIMLANILLWVFAYTVKPDWESRLG
jgi:hypothetical protein